MSLNDDLSDIFGKPDPLANLINGERRETPRPVDERFPGFTEKCPACKGRGRFISYAGRDVGPCFKCKGAGNRTFKTSPEARADNRASAAERKAKRKAEIMSAFVAEHGAVFDWLNAASLKGNSFAVSLMASLHDFGSLTPGQIAAVEKCIARDAERKAEAEARKINAPAVSSDGVDRLKLAFDKAIAFSAEKGLRLSPRITINGMTISPAKATSANAGALYVKNGGTYLGKITGGKFFASRECGSDDQASILAFIADPAQAAKVYGQTTGTCCVCNATLKSKWKELGIGPICAQKFGW